MYLGGRVEWDHGVGNEPRLSNLPPPPFKFASAGSLSRILLCEWVTVTLACPLKSMIVTE